MNKRVKALEESGYINRVGFKKTRAGFEASIYELTTKAYLAVLLNTINLGELLERVDNAAAQTILAVLMFTAQLT